MILDNEIKNNEGEDRKVHHWIASYTEVGKLDIVTGYFTVGALAWLSSHVNDKISKYRLVLGDIVNVDAEQERPLDLLNENITIEASLKLSNVAKEAVKFLKQEHVLAKTLEPNFCHAKSVLFQPDHDKRHSYFITGSSNLTEAGIGLKTTHNVELNLAETGDNSQYQELIKWFNDLWKKPQAHSQKTIIKDYGTKEKIDFKTYLIQEIERIFIEYTPRELYYKVLFELFGHQLLDIENDPDFNRRIGRLENSQIYNALYDFQKKGVLSLIRMLQNYNGAILADAVGLGKTWSALAVIKYFQAQGREIILICPKKLEHNWRRYKKNQNSRFEKDNFDYFIRYHTDMHEDRMNKPEYLKERADTLFKSEKPKLFVIDESHNLRNHKSNRYKFLMDEILKKNDDAKVLLLSATPINNNLNDIRNQFKMMVKGKTDGFYEKLDIRNLDSTFRVAQKAFNEWREDDRPVITDFIKKLPADFFNLSDALIVSRTRKMIEGQQNELTFPEKTKPLNLFVTPKQMGNFESFEELFDHFPPMLSGYQPSFYLDEEEKDVLYDEKQRDRFLVKMMYILLVKRLESSWFSFYSTVEKIKNHHQNALDKIKEYQKGLDSSIESEDEIISEDDDLESQFEEFSLGKKRKVLLSDIDEAGNLDNFKNDLKKDLEALEYLFVNLEKFEKRIKNETKLANNLNTEDDKLKTLLKIIKEKQARQDNNNNQKLVIFTVYRDTAEYLYNQLKDRGFAKLAMVTGSGSRTSYTNEEHKNFEPILEQFAPYTKLFKEKLWDFETDKNGLEAYKQWLYWIENNHPKTYEKLQKPIDILIATDSLSEGQNLQDADMVINYDIHWNPVRIIQRMGRIDRLGSPNDKIFGINFWPSNNINSYLNLQGRIEERMAAMKLAGAEVDEKFTDTFKEMIKDESLDQRMKNRMMQQMQVSLDDLDGEESFGFDDLSLERYRQDLMAELQKDKDKYQKMPNGVYSGFKADTTVCAEDGLIALLGYPAKKPKTKNHTYKKHDLIYINKKGEMVLLNQKEVLDALAFHNKVSSNNWERVVPKAIDQGDENAIQNLVQALKNWIDQQATEVEENEDGTTDKKMGTEPKDILAKLKRGDKSAFDRMKENTKVTDKYKIDNFDLITWFLVSV